MKINALTSDQRHFHSVNNTNKWQRPLSMFLGQIVVITAVITSWSVLLEARQQSATTSQQISAPAPSTSPAPNAILEKLEKIEANEKEINQSLNTPFWKKPDVIITVLLSLIGIVSAYLIATHQLRKGAKDLKETSQEIKAGINNIEEVASQRFILVGFDTIFSKAEDMLNKSKGSFWMLGFTPNFGYVHSYDNDTCKKLHFANSKQMQSQVNKFKHKILHKAEAEDVDTKFIYLDKALFKDAFIKNGIAKKINALENEKLQSDIDLQNSTTITMITENTKCPQDSENKSFKDVTFVQQIPLQMFITDSVVTKSDGVETRKSACLVFFTGTGNLTTEMPRGIYTESTELVNLFKSVFKGIIIANNNAEPTS